MISSRSFSVEWIENLCGKYSIRDKGILDKYLHALSFIEWISLKTNCILKGGTAVTLLSNIPLRFSIDVDIILKRDDIENILDDIIISNDNFY